MDFAKLREPDDVEPVRPRDGFGGLPGPAQVAGIDRIELRIDEPFGQTRGLLAAALGQRPVGVSLPPPLDVPITLAVPGEVHRGHGGYRRRPCSSASKSTSASSPARPKGSGRRPRACWPTKAPASLHA